MQTIDSRKNLKKSYAATWFTYMKNRAVAKFWQQKQNFLFFVSIFIQPKKHQFINLSFKNCYVPPKVCVKHVTYPFRNTTMGIAHAEHIDVFPCQAVFNFFYNSWQGVSVSAGLRRSSLISAASCNFIQTYYTLCWQRLGQIYKMLAIKYLWIRFCNQKSYNIYRGIQKIFFKIWKVGATMQKEISTNKQLHLHQSINGRFNPYETLVD